MVPSETPAIGTEEHLENRFEEFLPKGFPRCFSEFSHRITRLKVRRHKCFFRGISSLLYLDEFRPVYGVIVQKSNCYRLGIDLNKLL